MAKEDYAKQYKEDLAYNSANPMFNNNDCEMLGQRQQGYFSKIDDVNGRKFLCHTFDNGHLYYMNPNTKKVMQFTELRPDLFLHKYIETFTTNFIAQNNLQEKITTAPTVSFDDMTLADSNTTFLQVELDREENGLLISSLSLGDVELEKKLLAGIFRLCSFCSFQFFVGKASEEVITWLKGLGAEEEEDEDGTILALPADAKLD